MYKVYKQKISLVILILFLFTLMPIKNVNAAEILAAPTGLTAIPVNQVGNGAIDTTQPTKPSIFLNWTAVTDATSYNIYRSVDGGTNYTLLANSTTATYKDSSVAIGSSYYYKVSSVKTGEESDKTEAATAYIYNAINKFDVGCKNDTNADTGYVFVSSGVGTDNKQIKDANGNVVYTQYTDELGYGLVGVPGSNSRDRGGSLPNGVYSDFAVVDGLSFKVKLPIGKYSINFICGSLNTDNGGTTNVTVNGQTIASIAYAKGAVTEGYGVTSVTSDAPLEMKFSGSGTNTRINGMIITPMGYGPTELEQSELNVSATPAYSTLSWGAAKDAISYNIYRKSLGDVAFVKIDNTTETTYKDTNVVVGRTYIYYVSAVSLNGEAPSASKVVPVTDQGVTVLAAPIGIEATREPFSSALVWNKDPKAIFYNVYQKSSIDTDYKIIGSVVPEAASTVSFKDENLTENLNYDYKVTAVNRGGESEPATVSSKAAIPQVPAAIKVDKVGWSVVELTSSSTNLAIGCNVYRSESIDGEYTLLGKATKANNDYNYKDTSVASEKTYYYKFAAFNYTGESEKTAAVKITTKAVIGKADAPAELTLTSITKSVNSSTNVTSYIVRVDWTYSYGSTGYNVYRSTNATSGFTKIGTSTNGYYKDTIANGVENTPYYYKISATNPSGESGMSEALAAKLTSNFRITPKGLTATSQMPTTKAINLAWTSVTGADSYNVYRSLKDDNNYTKIGNSTVNSFVDNTGVLGNSYKYRVTSVDNTNGESLKTYALNLNWTAVTDVAKYNIYRKIKGALDSTYVKLGEASTNTYLDDTALAGVSYQYKITNSTDTTATALTTLVGTEWIPTASLTDANASLMQDTANELSYSYDEDILKLNWQAVNGATSYNIYKSSFKDSKYNFIGNSDINEFIVPNNNEGGTYYYKVTALNAAGETNKSEAIRVVPKVTLKRQMENIDRGINAVKVSNGVLVSWRYLGTDSEGISFNVYRDNVKINSTPITTSTNYLDASGNTTSKYYVTSVINGQEVETSKNVTPWENNFKDIPIKKPAQGITKAGAVYDYAANDASVADLDGDGEYEIVLKWDPTNSQDNSAAGYTGNTYIDAYELDGTFMWRIDLGVNVRAGAHYTDIMVYDFDGDGKAEVTVRTADGTIDGLGNIIGDDKADYRNTSGYVLNGPEYHTMFEGTTGKALASVPYEPQRGDFNDWGDNYGNRVDRFIAAIAYLDGKTPSIIMQRGYYTRMVIEAYNWKDGKFIKVWSFDTNYDEVDQNGLAYKGYEYQGNHQMSIADVDNDGMDEVITGASVIDNNGKPLYTTRLGHGDAMHVGDLDPTRPGLEMFQVQEDVNSPYGMDLRDPGTGEILFGVQTGMDTGRGLSADIDPNYLGEEIWSSDGSGIYNIKGEKIANNNSKEAMEKPSINYAIWWDGDLQRELLDHNWVAYTTPPTPAPGRIDKWDYNTNTRVNLLTAEGTSSVNGTKGNPSLQADLLGDWREEVIWRLGDNSALRIYTTPYETENRIFTLMHDPIYRLGVAWQNTGYNQPPHTSFYLGSGMTTPKQPNISMLATGETVINEYEATLSSITVDGSSINGFNSDNYEYNVVLPASYIGIPLVNVTTTDSFAKAKITPATMLPGTTTIEVTSGDNLTTKTYKINFTLESEDDPVVTPPSNNSGSTGNNGNTNNNGTTNSVPVNVVVDNSGSTPKVVINFDSANIAKDKVNEVKPTISDTTKALELKVKVDNIKGGTGSLALAANKLTMSIPFSIMDLSNVQTGAYAKLEQTTSSTDEILKGTNSIGEVLTFNLALYSNEGTKLSEVHEFAQGKVKINLQLTDAQIKNLNISKLGACYYNEEKNKWEYVGGNYDSATKTFSFETEHFSKFTVADMSTAPVFGEVVAQNAEQGNFLQFKVNASSSNNMNLTYTAENLPTGASFDTVNQNLNWTPNVDQAGSYTISFNVTDGVNTVKKDVTVEVRDVPAVELVEKALAEKDFYHFNIAYYKVAKLSDEKEKAENLDKLATIHDLVWNTDIANINKILEDLVATGSGKIYDDVQAVINGTNLSAVDKGYLLGEVTSWGKKLVFTNDYKNAVDAVVVAWDKLDADSISKAEVAIAKVTNAHSKEYLLEEIAKIKAKIK